MRPLAVCVALLVIGCEARPNDLGVALQSDLVLEHELVEAEIEIRRDRLDGPMVFLDRRSVRPGDYASGVRHLELEDLPPGSYFVYGRAFDRRVVERASSVTAYTHTGPGEVRVQLLRCNDDCLDCEDASECPPMNACAPPACLMGICAYPPRDTCAAGICFPDRGCVVVEPDADGGVGCASDTRDCNEDPTDECEVMVTSDPAHCGECGRACGPNMACVAGACVCEDGFASCDGRDVTGCETAIATDPARCGDCGMACADGETCVDGACRCGASAPCTTGLTCCAGTCVDVSADVSHCGACERECTGIGTDTCTDRACTCGGGAPCPSGQRCCDGACVSRSGFEHCNGCGVACDPQRADVCDGSFGCICAGSGFSSCPSGFRCCSSGCVAGTMCP